MRFACALLIAPALLAQNAALDQKISSALASSGAPSISVAVVQNGEIAYAKAFGKANIAENQSADAATRYAIGSVSKQFTAAALLLLEEQGRISLDDKVSKFLPELTRASEVTIRELLSHTSGYEDYAPQDYMIPAWTRPIAPREILDQWAKKPLNFDPGTRWQYSNTNYVIAGQIVERVSGQTLLAFLREKIFQPLGMTTPGDISEHQPGDASAYTRYAIGPPRPVVREGPGWMFAAGELAMTPSDLARWDLAFLQKRILSAPSYEEFTHEVKLKDGKDTHYALGLSLGDLNGTPMISHSGEVSGFLTENAVFPTKGVAVVVCSNEDGINLIGPLARQIEQMVLGGAPEKELAQVRGILEGLREGQVDRAIFTADANSYFNEIVLKDYTSSLGALGKLLDLTKTNEQQRGGMTHRTYRARYEKKTVSLNVYVTPDGSYEQFLVEESL
ncbi:MAG: serine hydrolase domain-containing protein [Bryobacteraceae bacterium]